MPKRWSDRSKDPAGADLLEHRRREVPPAASDGVADDRADYLCAQVKGKSVLDVGVVGHTLAATESPSWLHARLRASAAACLGVDVLAEEVAALVARGYDVVCADLTRAPLERRFDVIVAGEVIEHLDRPGDFMRSCAAMLAPGGRLIVTTPNPWYANTIVKSAFGGGFVDNADHVAWLDPFTLFELGGRHGLRLERIVRMQSARPRTLVGRLFFWLRPALVSAGLNPRVFSKSLIYEFVRDESR
jgi:2-polyprenyl-3-methyl-5-hydroxy-6-metoxy-1,4-benzoquinol methylase